MKKMKVKQRKSVDFRKGVRGKYANMKLVVVGPTNERSGRLVASSRTSADVVLKKVSRVLRSAGSTKQEMESAISRARQLIDTEQST